MEFNLCSWWHSDLTAKGKCDFFFPGIMAEMSSKLDFGNSDVCEVV